MEEILAANPKPGRGAGRAGSAGAGGAPRSGTPGQRFSANGASSPSPQLSQQTPEQSSDQLSRGFGSAQDPQVCSAHDPQVCPLPLPKVQPTQAPQQPQAPAQAFAQSTPPAVSSFSAALASQPGVQRDATGAPQPTPMPAQAVPDRLAQLFPPHDAGMGAEQPASAGAVSSSATAPTSAAPTAQQAFMDGGAADNAANAPAGAAAGSTGGGGAARESAFANAEAAAARLRMTFGEALAQPAAAGRGGRQPARGRGSAAGRSQRS